MIHFFISYTQADRTWAEWIAWVLKEAGFDLYLQAWDSRPGTNFVAEMHRASTEADRTLLVLSPDYLCSEYGLAEWTAAYSRDPTGRLGKVLPVRVREIDPTGLLGPISYIDLVGLPEAVARERLLAGLPRGRSLPPVRPPFPESSGPRYPGGPLRPPDLEKASNRLAALPVDEIPEPGPLPPGSWMPHSVNPLFVGRREELLQLARHLKVGETAAVGQIAAATGLGGIGKTQLASELVHRYGRFFEGGVFWMSFAAPAAIPAEVATCGRILGLHPNFDSLPLERQVQLVQDAWRSPLPRLLVFDNCEDAALLKEWRPSSGGARVLLTSRRPHWDLALGVRSLPLNTLPRSAGLELLRRFRPDLPEEDSMLDSLAQELGDLPLALHLAGSFLLHYKEASFGQPAAYLEQLRRGDLLAHPSLEGQGSEISPTGHEAHVARTFALSYERLEPDNLVDALARKLLARTSCFAPGEPIPRALLLATLQLGEEDPDAAVLAEDALGRLIGLGLLETGEGGWALLHRLVAVFARSQGVELEDREAVESTLAQEAGQLNSQGYPALLLAWQPHLQAVTDSASPREDVLSALLCNQFGLHLNRIGDPQGALPYYQRSLEITEKVFGLDHPNTAIDLNNLGLLFEELGDYAEAGSCLMRALAIREEELGSRHPDTATSLDSLGNLLRVLGDFPAARSYYERALEILEEELGPEHRDTAVPLSNLGDLYLVLGDLSEARSHHQRALEILEKTLGPEHPDTARSLNNLGTVLQKLGDFSGAYLHYERALIAGRKSLGPEHLEVGITLNNLGLLEQARGDFSAARSHYRQALAIWEKILGSEHPKTALARNNLGTLLILLGDFPEARQHLDRALEAQEKILGPEHPDTAMTLGNLGSLFQSLGDFSAALPYYERALKIWEKVLGSDHPDLVKLLGNLGLAHQELGDLEKANSYFERDLAICEEVLGPEHPDTARGLNNLGLLHHNRGDLPAARWYYEKALAILEEAWGPEHPDAAACMSNLGLVLRELGDLPGARSYGERALAILENSFGSEHPNVKMLRQSLATLTDPPSKSQPSLWDLLRKIFGAGRSQ